MLRFTGVTIMYTYLITCKTVMCPVLVALLIHQFLFLVAVELSMIDFLLSLFAVTSRAS